jgi:hypothetical protein
LSGEGLESMIVLAAGARLGPTAGRFRMLPRSSIFAFAAFAACTTTAGGPSTTTTACTWPASLDDVDAAAGACHAKRALVQCSLPGGLTEGCLSDDLAQCPGSADAGGTCTDQCAAGEYGVACGQVGPTPIGTPPAACRDMGAIPAGIVYYCCPCGS